MCFSHNHERAEVGWMVSDLRFVVQEMVLAQFPTFREADFSGAMSAKDCRNHPDIVLNFRYNPANMIQDAKKWNVGISLLSGFMQHFPTSPDEDQVEQFHGIVKILEEASGEDFSHFKIPTEKLAPRVTSVRPGGYGGGSGSATYSKKKYCDSSYFRSQVHGLANYIGTMRVKSSAKAANPYESLTDDQLMAMLADRNIRPKRVPGGNPEYVHDRSYAIAALLTYDNPPAPTAPTHSTVINMHSSNLNFQSPGASITQTSDFKSDDFRKLIESMKRFASTQELPPESREQISIDIGTAFVLSFGQRSQREYSRLRIGPSSRLGYSLTSLRRRQAGLIFERAKTRVCARVPVARPSKGREYPCDP